MCLIDKYQKSEKIMSKTLTALWNPPPGANRVNIYLKISGGVL